MRIPFVVAAALWVTSARAEGQPLTLERAQAEARVHAPEAAELEARLRGAEAIAADARRILRNDPVVSGSYRSGAPSGRADEWTVDAALAWTVDLSGSWRLRRGAGEADLEVARTDRVEGLRALDEAVAVAFAEVAREQRAVDRGRRLAALQTIAADAARKEMEVGKGSQLDLDAAELDLAGARAFVAQAERALSIARVGLARLLGRQTEEALTVAEDGELGIEAAPADVSELVSRAPLVRSAEAAVDAARLTLRLRERLVWPMPTFSIGYDKQRLEVPAGAFGSAPGLSASWIDQELTFGVSFPIPLLDRQREPRARTFARTQDAIAAAARVRADVRERIETSLAGVRGAAVALRELAGTPKILERELDLLQQAVRAGALDAVTRAQALRRLAEAGRRYDDAVFDLRVARARWLRWSVTAP